MMYEIEMIDQLQQLLLPPILFLLNLNLHVIIVNVRQLLNDVNNQYQKYQSNDNKIDNKQYANNVSSNQWIQL